MGLISARIRYAFYGPEAISSGHPLYLMKSHPLQLLSLTLAPFVVSKSYTAPSISSQPAPPSSSSALLHTPLNQKWGKPSLLPFGPIAPAPFSQPSAPSAQHPCAARLPHPAQPALHPPPCSAHVDKGAIGLRPSQHPSLANPRRRALPSKTPPPRPPAPCRARACPSTSAFVPMRATRPILGTDA
ncbi:vegetative cell wall protein gp1-like [Sorghum bicolor]|uniref:vegetative cell wall protein gp1-like n=1 Tax=Sorghum bicolor TaxID=4558 RepID=UPI000B4250CE|nr:vegetative cell wall protein gp1-like [Sorghum bicolor]|eukprot:XP_021309073.1 vegetative cell wall protein gp1-like [Sorghum bicolor]